MWRKYKVDESREDRTRNGKMISQLGQASASLRIQGQQMIVMAGGSCVVRSAAKSPSSLPRDVTGYVRASLSPRNLYTMYDITASLKLSLYKHQQLL